MFQVNQVLYAKADCMNNFRRHQQVTLTEQVSPTSFILDDVVELQSSVLEQYFMTEEQYKALSENNSSTHTHKYLSMFKQGNLEYELEGLVGKEIKASGTMKRTYNHPFNGDVEETRPYGFEGLIIGYSKEVVVENGVRAYKYMLLTDEGMAFSVVPDMIFELADGSPYKPVTEPSIKERISTLLDSLDRKQALTILAGIIHKDFDLRTASNLVESDCESSLNKMMFEDRFFSEGNEEAGCIDLKTILEAVEEVVNCDDYISKDIKFTCAVRPQTEEELAEEGLSDRSVVWYTKDESVDINKITLQFE